MTVYIGSARCDENGAAHGGAAGDQNGKEVAAQKWYRHSKGWRVMRCNDPDRAEKIAAAMQAACDNNDIGYDQWQRATLRDNVAPYGYDPAKTTKKVETDCSELARTCVAYAYGEDIVAAVIGSTRWSTANMCGFLTKTGRFTELKDAKYTTSADYLRRGDILCTATQGHTVVVLNDGAKAADDKPYELGDRVLRKGDCGDDVAELQTLLIAKDYDCGSYGADGEFGTATQAAVKAFQGDTGLTVDGVVGAETVAALTSEPQEPGSGGYVVTGNSVYLLETPAEGANRVAVAHRGDILRVVDISERVPVWHNGKVLFINKKYIEDAK